MTGSHQLYSDMEEPGSKFTQPLIIKYRPPWWLDTLNLLVHLLAMYCVAIAAIPLSLKLILISTISYWLCVAFKESCKIRKNSTIQTIRLDATDHWQLVKEEGGSINMKLVDVGFYSPFLLVLRFKSTDLKKIYVNPNVRKYQ